MRLFKKLGVVLSMAAVGVMAAFSPVSAASDFNDVRPSYTEPFYGLKRYDGNVESAYINQSRVTSPANWYLDSYVQKSAQNFINSGYSVLDLRTLAGFGMYYLSCQDNVTFNYGFLAVGEEDSDIAYMVCKCSKSDFNKLVDYLGTDIISRNGNNIKATDEYYSDIDISFDSDKLLLTIKARIKL